MPSNTPQIDVLVLCALQDEYKQLLKVEEGITSQWEEFTGSSGRIIAKASFNTDSGSSLTIAATFAGYMGREQIQAVASTLIHEYNPKCLAMSGICAGRRNKVALGDVIFAERLWSYDAGKSVVEDGKEVFQGDMLQYRPSEPWVQHMQVLPKIEGKDWLNERPELPLENQENWVLKCLHAGEVPSEHEDFDLLCPDWADVIQRLWKRQWVDESLSLTDSGKAYISKLLILYPKTLPAAPAFGVSIAPVATGAVVKEDEKMFDRLASSMRKVLGLDMEGSGLAASAEAHNMPIIFAKGVSDFGDGFKDDRYRHFAARASAELLLLLLRRASHLINSPLGGAEKEVPSYNPVELVSCLAELYPSIETTQSLWERSGGRISELEYRSKPTDLWQLIWKRVNQGTSVTPESLIKAALVDYPTNKILKEFLSNGLFS